MDLAPKMFKQKHKTPTQKMRETLQESFVVD